MMTPPTRRKFLLATVCVLVVVGARASLSLALIHDGFRALSDDDYSRVVIAQQFTVHPSFDPSQTSWLPFPFWLYGTLMAGLGNSLAVARELAFAVGLVSSALLWVTARWLGLSRTTSTIGSLIAMSTPYSSWLGLATTPEVLTAALILAGCASLTRKHLNVRMLGATAIVAATLSRYEAWPVALLWALFTARDAIRLRKGTFAVLALAALSTPVFWMLHGRVAHNDALFFIKRVADYQQSLGLAHRASRISSAYRVIADAPELSAFVVTVAASCGLHRVRFLERRWVRPLWCLLGLFLFLCVGDWRESTATHHGGRTLLSVWNLVSLMGAAGLAAVMNAATARARARFLASTLCSMLIIAQVIRARTSCSAQPRAEEVAMGLLAASQIPSGQTLAIETPDYGYFAVQAAFARPLHSRVLDRHDPREHSSATPHSAAVVRRKLEALSATWVVASRTNEQMLSSFTTIRKRGPGLLLAEVR